MGSRENPLSFASLPLVDLRSGQSQYLSTLKQLLDALPKTLDPASRFALRDHITRPGQPRLRHSVRAAMWFLLPSDGVFRRSSSSIQHYLTRQGRRVVLRGGGGGMYPDLPWNATSTGSLTRPPPLQEIMAKKITLPQQKPASFPAK